MFKPFINIFCSFPTNNQIIDFISSKFFLLSVCRITGRNSIFSFNSFNLTLTYFAFLLGIIHIYAILKK